MDQTDDKLRQLFESSIPEFTPSGEFLKRIERNIEAVDLVRKNQAAIVVKSRRAAFLSGMAGFICGVILTLLYPFILNLLSGLFMTMAQLKDYVEIVSMTATYGLIASGSVAGAMGTYYFLTQNQSENLSSNFFKI